MMRRQTKIVAAGVMSLLIAPAGPTALTKLSTMQPTVTR